MAIELPDASKVKYNIEFSNAVTFALPIEEVYAKLGPDIEGPLYASKEDHGDPFDMADFSSTAIERGLKRIIFRLGELLDYKVTNMTINLVGTVTETLPVNFSSGEVSMVYASYAVDQKIFTLKERIFTRLPEAEGRQWTKVEEREHVDCSAVQSFFVRMTGPGVHRQHMHQYHRLFTGRCSPDYLEEKWGKLPAVPASLPDAPNFNLAFECAVSINLSLEEVYDQLGRGENLEKVIRRHSIVIEIDVQKPTYSAEKKAFDDIHNPFTLDFPQTDPRNAVLKRARFIFSEAVEYPIKTVLVILEGSQLEQQPPDFASGSVQVLYCSYARKQSLWVRKERTMTRLADFDGKPRTKVHESVKVACSKLHYPFVRMSSRGLHSRHMLAYDKLWTGKDVKTEML